MAMFGLGFEIAIPVAGLGILGHWADEWLDTAPWDDGDADIYELGSFLRELQEGLGTIRNIGERLYILLEEKAY